MQYVNLAPPVAPFQCVFLTLSCVILMRSYLFALAMVDRGFLMSLGPQKLHAVFLTQQILKKKIRTPICVELVHVTPVEVLRWRGLLVIATWASEQRETVDLEMVQNEICTMIAKLFNWRARATRTLRLPPALSLCISQRVIAFGVSVELRMVLLDEEDGWRLIGWSRLTIERANPT